MSLTQFRQHRRVSLRYQACCRIKSEADLVVE